MAATKNQQPIIVIKRKVGHGGHHGGAWKVAYADFVTAMMSLFIVLWLMGSSEKVKKAVAGYFNDPKGTASLLGTTMTGTGESVHEASTDQLEKLKDKLEQEIKARKDLEKLSKQIEITITPEGLRIELLEGKDGTFFEIGGAKLSESGQSLLALLASELKTLPNSLLIEGHTDSTPYSNDGGYSNWDLSADRANSARRLLQQDGVRTDQVTQVRGYADQMLRVRSNPTDPSNRRVSILVKNDNETVPEISAAKIVDGSMPLSGAGGTATGQKDAVSKPGSNAIAATPVKAVAPDPGPAPAPTAPTAGTTSKGPGLMDRLRVMLRGGKK
jgi:chemotaxis protein MotB